MNAIHALGYSMLMTRGYNLLEEVLRKYHQSVHMILWDGEKSWDGIRENIYMGSELPIPPPNGTSLNFPIW